MLLLGIPSNLILIDQLNFKNTVNDLASQQRITSLSLIRLKF